ncbi:hypothetical protein XB02_09230 [Pantoea ananatis]|nr:hypothetical protein XB02_09230 [Pantoea ananatis]
MLDGHKLMTVLTRSGIDCRARGSIGLGALLAGSVSLKPAEKVCVLLTGGNWDLADLAEIYAVK